MTTKRTFGAPRTSTDADWSNAMRCSRPMDWRVAALAGLAAGVLAGCATLHRDNVVAPVDGGAVTLRSGAAFVVSLAPDPATGYGWVLKSADPGLWEIGGPDATQDPKPPGLMGVAGTTAYRFRAKAPGTSTIEFAWQAPPGQPAAPDKVVRYTVTALPPAWFGIM
jgi:inhibitor of cysteine peptidase